MEEIDGVKLTTLDNGLRVVSIAMSTVKTVSVGIWVHAGSRLEQANDSGVAHFLEHMSFKGTERRTALQIAEEIELVGGHSNAYTSKEKTAYYIRLLSEDLPLAVDILSDILINSSFQEAEIERERGVILQEIAMYEDQPDDMAFENFQQQAYPDQSLGRPIIGTKENVKNMSRGQLQGYIEQHYSADRSVIVAAGEVDHQAFVDLVKERFNALKCFDTPQIEAAKYVGGEHRQQDDCEQLHCVLGWPSCSYREIGEHYASVALAGIAGGGMSSRLFQQVREQRGLAYSVHAFQSAFQDTGILGVYTATSPEKAAEAVELSQKILEDMCQNIDEKELAKVRAQLKSSLLMGLESSSSRAEGSARQLLLHGRIVPINEHIERIEALDKSFLQTWLSEILSRPACISLYGNVDKVRPLSLG